MLKVTAEGLHCAAGGFHIDPWRAVDRALITHAHSDHARPGSRAYLCAADGVEVLRLRVGADAPIQGVPYGDPVVIDGVRVSFHPAGHILGSAQIRLEAQGEVWVVTGDFKLHSDPTCRGFEPVRCDTLVTESTFGLPVYRWPDTAEVFAEIHSWWRDNQAQGRTSVLFGYSLGKAQRLLAGLDPSVGPILVHPAAHAFLPAYHAAGVRLPPADRATVETVRQAAGRALLIAPSAAEGAAWWSALGDLATAFASGWMLLRGTRRRQGVQRGFVVSDHADWNGLLTAIRGSDARRVYVTHGFEAPLVRWLRENGWEAASLPTPFRGEGAEGRARDAGEDGPPS